MGRSPTIIVYIAASLDGFIATPDGGVDWLAPYQADYGYDAFIASVHTLVMGGATYDQMRGFGDWPHGGKRILVVTSRPLGDNVPAGVEAWPDGVDALGAELRATSGSSAARGSCAPCWTAASSTGWTCSLFRGCSATVFHCSSGRRSATRRNSRPLIPTPTAWSGSPTGSTAARRPRQKRQCERQP